MISYYLLLITIFNPTINSACNMSRPSWKQNYNGFHNTRQYILYHGGKNIIMENNNIVQGEFECFYNHDKFILTNKNSISYYIEIDHLFPWAEFKKRAKNCNQALDFFNDIDNLKIASKMINRRKSDQIDSNHKDHNCKICKKYDLDCNDIC